jgi:hypothetical protein
MDLDASFDDDGLAVIDCSSTSPAISSTLKPAEPISALMEKAVWEHGLLVQLIQD